MKISNEYNLSRIKINEYVNRQNNILKSITKAETLKDVQKISKEFEAIFLEFMIKSMRDTIHKSKFIHGGTGEEIFTSLLDAEYAKSIAEQQSNGLGKIIEQELLRMINIQNGNLKSLK